jgi:cytochrome c
MRGNVVVPALLAAALAASIPFVLAQDDEKKGGPEDEKAAKAAEEDAARLGAKMFRDASLGTNERSCSTCHDNPKRPDLSLKGVTSRFPRWDRTAAKVITLQQKFVQMQERSLKARKPIPIGDDRWTALEVHLRGLK